MEQVILVRHGESEYSARGALNGDPAIDVQLTPEGREQARRLGELLEAERIDLCVTTEFGRTKETADIALMERPDIPRVVMPELNDVQAGDVESRAVEDYRAWRRENGPAVTPPGVCESRSETVRRL